MSDISKFGLYELLFTMIPVLLSLCLFTLVGGESFDGKEHKVTRSFVAPGEDELRQLQTLEVPQLAEFNYDSEGKATNGLRYTFTSICELYKSFWLASILKDLHSVLIQHMSWKIIYSYFRNGISASLFYLGICLYFCENKTAKCWSTNIRTYTRC